MNLWNAVTMQGLTPRVRSVGLAVLGIFIGGGAWVANMSNAASYLSDDPKACINCHVMGPEYATWKHSSHANVASCNDCHVPHDSTWRKYWFKANDGLRHSTIFTLRKEPQVMQARAESREVIQQNCVHCHAEMIQPVSGSGAHGFDRSCVECHREVPHGRVHSLSSTPNAAIPLLETSNVAQWINNKKSLEKSNEP